MWIITDFEDLFTQNFACCNPYKFRGCICDVKRSVHVGQDPLLFEVSKAVPKKTPKITPRPEPPNYPPPKPTIMAYINIFDEARQRFESALAMERENMHTVVVQSDEFVLVEARGKFDFVDFNRVKDGMVPNTMCEMLKITDLKMIQGEGDISATTLEYYVDQECTTPDSYHCSVGGEKISIRANSYSDGWIAASFDQCEWKWFPLVMCVP